MLNDILNNYTKIELDKAAVCQDMQFIGIDNGSTGTRSYILLETPSSDKTVETISYEQLELDHRYTEVEMEDEIDLLPVTTNDVLADKLDIIIENYNVDGYIDYTHIVKGKMATNLGKPSPRLITSLSKVYQRQTYINILSSIGVTLMSKAVLTGESYGTDIDIDLSATLPQEDFIVEKTEETFKQRLVGQYSVRFPQMNYEVRFNISEENIHVTSEPNAVGNALPREDVDFQKEVICDIGGRSTGCILVTNGRVNQNFQTTSPVCGQNLIKTLTRLVNRTLNIPIVERDIYPEIFSTGILYYNATSYDVVDLINKAKASFVNSIVQMYLGFLDESNEPATCINKLTVSGRVFTEIERDGKIVSPSILYKLRRDIADISPNTSVELFKVDYPILIGLMRERLQNI